MIGYIHIKRVDLIAPYTVTIGTFYFQFIFPRRKFGDDDIGVVFVVNPFIGEVNNPITKFAVLVVDKVVCCEP